MFFSLQGEIGCTDTIEHRIPLKEGATSVRQARRRLPLHGGWRGGREYESNAGRGRYREGRRKRIVPYRLVRKRDHSIRFCVDLRATNLRTRKSSHLSPRIEETIEAMAKGIFYNFLDIKSAYLPIEIAPEH